MKENMLPREAHASFNRKIEPKLGLTSRSHSPYAKNGSIVFMSDHKTSELLRGNTTTEKPVAQPTVLLSPEDEQMKQEFMNAFLDWKRNNPDMQSVDEASVRQLIDQRFSQAVQERAMQENSPQKTGKDTSHPSPEDVYANADKSMLDRMLTANEMLMSEGAQPLTTQQIAQIEHAHNVGINETGLDGNAAGVYNFTPEQIARKARAMRDFTPEQRRVLMEAGIAGIPGDAPGAELYEESEGRSTTGREDALRAIAEATEKQQIQIDTAKKREENFRKAVQDADSSETLKELIEKLEQNVQIVGRKLTTRHSNIPTVITEANFALPFEKYVFDAKNDLNSGKDSNEVKAILLQAAEELGRQELEWARSEAAAKEGEKEGREGMKNIANYRDLAESIMETAPGMWGSAEFNKREGLNGGLKGDHPLLNPDGSMNKGNFLEWERYKIVEQHGFDPDERVVFFNAISVDNPNMYRSANISTMTSNYGIYFRDKVKNAEGKEEEVIQEDVKDEAINYAWLIGEIRNLDVLYRQNMSSDTRFADNLVALFKSNTFGKEDMSGTTNTMAKIFTLDQEFAEKSKGEMGDMKIGSAIRAAYLMYYHHTDPEKLHELFQHNFTLFDKKEMEEAIKLVKKDENVPDEEFLREAGMHKVDGAEGTIMDLYDANGKIKEGMEGVFLKEMNVFSPPTKNRAKLAVMRRLISRAAARQAGLLDDNGNVNQAQANFPELVAYLMTYWTGAASRQDIGFAALNAFTKTEHFKGYLLKQADPSRAGGIGNARQLELLKKITVDPMLGILTTEGKTTLETIENMQKIHNQYWNDEAKRKEEMNKLKRMWSYDDRAWSQYAPQHVANGFKEFHDRTSGKQVRFESFVHYELQTGRTTYDTEKMISEVQENIIKPTRYRWSTHKIDYGFEQRTLQVQSDLPNKKTFLEKIGVKVPHHHSHKSKEKAPVYETETIAEAMFGPQVLLVAQEILMHENPKLAKRKFLNKKGRIIRYDDNGKEVTKGGKIPKEVKDLLNDKDFSRIVSKSYLLCKFATMLYYNTTKNGPGHLLDISTRELIIRGIGSITAGVASDPEDFTKTEITKKYFTDFDLRILRRLSKNEFGRNMLRQGSIDIASGLVGGVGKGLKATAKEIKI